MKANQVKIKKEPSPVSRKLFKLFTPMGTMKNIPYTILAVLAFVLIIGVWCYLSYVKKISSMFLPDPVNVLQTAGKMFTEQGFLNDVYWSVRRVLIGFAVSVIVGVPLGVLIGTYAPCSAFMEPFFSFFRYLPASAFIQLFILWIGIDEAPKIAIIIVGSLAQIVLMVATNIRNVEISLIEVSYTLGISKGSALWKIIVPRSMPDIVDTLRIVLGWAWTYIIVAEMIGASDGIGFTITQAGRQFWVNRIFVCILVIGVIGLGLDMLFMKLRKVLFSWNEN